VVARLTRAAGGRTLVRTDLATGKPSLALDVDVKAVDFPTEDVDVTALAVSPEWSAEQRG